MSRGTHSEHMILRNEGYDPLSVYLPHGQYLHDDLKLIINPYDLI